MPHLPAELFHDWHDFFVLVGTASATLVGLMFVAASIGSNYFNEDHSAAMQTFLTPTVVHFVAVLMVCLLCTIPNHNWVSLSVLLGAEGIAGTIYCGSILLQFTLQHRFKVDLGDRLFYAVLPAFGYLLLIVTAALLMMRLDGGARRDRGGASDLDGSEPPQRLGHDVVDRDQDADGRPAA